MTTGWVDAHVHLLPPRMAAKVRAVFDAHLPGLLAYPTDPLPVLADLAASGITQAWVLPYAHRPGIAGQLVADTAAHLTELRDQPVELVLAATLHPGDAEPVDLLDEAVDTHGARLVKVHGAVGGFSIDDPGLARAFDHCVARRLPVVAHVGTHAAGSSGQDDLAAVERVAQRHPDLRLIIAHAGQPAVGATLAAMDRHPSLLADLTPVVTRVPHVEDTDLVRFADRILFGSDTPNTGHRVGDLLTFVTARDLPDEVVDAVLGGNARRLLAEVR